MEKRDKIQSYRDLLVWQKSRELVLLTYKLTKKFPKDERFALMSQTRRAATSITANLAEGYGRFANKDREHFYVIARGSLYELDSHIQIARDLNYLDENEHKEFVNLQEDVSRLLSAFIRTHRANNK